MADSSTPRGDGSAELRRLMKQRRRDLRAAVGDDHAVMVARHIVAISALTRARSIGAYVAVGGELDPSPTLSLLTAAVYVPIVGVDFSMDFKRFSPELPMVPNRYGIDEPPASAPSIDATELDAVLVPLVAFDAQGARLGMGAGYYDRCFAFRKSVGPRPLLVGIAHGFQQVDRIASEEWDVPLDLVVTEHGLVVDNRPAGDDVDDHRN